MIGRLLAGAACAIGLAGAVQAQDAEPYKIFLSMSYIGNDWQAEASNMIKALAASEDYKDRVDLEVQVAGPNAQRQIQQINAMVQAGADAIDCLSDLAHGAEQRGAQRLLARCDDHRL